MGKDAEFLDACRNGNVQLVEKFINAKSRRSGPLASLRRGPGVNVQDSSGYTGLHHAALNGHRSVVSLLLRHEASINVQDDKGSIPLHLAAWAGHTHVTKVLLQQGPSLPHINHQNKGGDTALHCAAQYGHTDTARLLLDHRADPTLPNLKAETPLDLAAQFGRLSIAELLIKEGHHDLLRPFAVDAATTAVFPHTPLHLASRNGHLAVVRLLLSHGHHVNVRTGIGSPLHEAAICGKVDVVRTLMEAGADADVRNDRGLTVLDTIAAINTPVTQEISGLIRSHHARLIDFGDDDLDHTADEGVPEEVTTETSSCPSPVSTIVSFEFPPMNNPSIQLESSPPPPYSVSDSLVIPARSSLAGERPSSAPTFCSSLTTILRPESVLTTQSSSPPYLPTMLPPSDFGSPYENVLIPTPVNKESSDGDRPTRTIDRRVIKNKKRDKTYPFTTNTDWARSSDRDSRLSDTGCGRSSDCDGLDERSSVTSEFSSVYDIPPPPKRASSISDRSSISTRSSSTHDILEDDSSYDVPPSRLRPPTKVRSLKDLSDRDHSNKPHPPPKPPRRSICPPSPSEMGDDSSYEMICFASSGNPADKKAQVPVQNEIVFPRAVADSDSSEIHYKALSHASARTRKGGRFSSDSDSDSGTQQRTGRGHSNKAYTSMTFKPVKSKRTSKSSHLYENTTHNYENYYHRYNKSPKRNTTGDALGKGYPLQRSQTVDQQTHLSRKSMPDPLGILGYALPLRPKSSQLTTTTDGMSDDSEGERRPPKSLNLRIEDKFPSEDKVLQKRSSKDIETETEPEDSLPVEVSSTGVGSSPPLTDDDVINPGLKSGGAVEWGNGGSSCSVSSASAASLSDKSGGGASTDNIEEVRSDVPFAGLFRGSRTPSDPCALMAVERPRSLTSPATSFRGFEKIGCRNSYPIMKQSAYHNSYSNNNNVDDGAKECNDQPKQPPEKGGVLSPLEEDEEWARISDIMASFGAGVTRESVFMAELEQEFQQRLGMSLSPSQNKLSLLLQPQTSVEATDKPTSKAPLSIDVGSWLKSNDLGQFEALFLNHGYDDLNFLNGLLDQGDLLEMGITEASHRDKLLLLISDLPATISIMCASNRFYETIEDWLAAINLSQYSKVFSNHGFGDMEKVRKIWEVELTVVLEVTLSGHRKRMLSSLGDRPIEPELPPELAPQDLSLELSKLNTDICELKEKLFNELPASTSREYRPPENSTNTIKRGGLSKRRAAPPPPPKAPRVQPSFDQSFDDGLSDPKQKPSGRPLSQLALRDPSQLVVGEPNSLLTTWKHHPTTLVESHVQYMAQYLGSTHVKELKGTESTMKSIQKLRRSTADGAKVPRIVLSVSFHGVRFIDGETKNVVCEHEIRNIHCACQDSDDLSHFAYITKDIETQGHYCHVFRVQSRDLATEIIMTLGEAFEVAYQLALRDQLSANNQSDEQKLAQGHSRSKSEHFRVSKQLVTNNSSHARSHSTATHPLIGGSIPPNTSLENLLSDSGNFSDKDVDGLPPHSRRERSSSPSVSSNSTSGGGTSCQPPLPHQVTIPPSDLIRQGST